MSDDHHRSRGTGDQGHQDSPFPWMQGELEEEIAPPFRPWMIAVAVASMAIFVVAVWYAWSAGQSDMDAPPVLVQADETPVKVLPEEPGGMEVPHQENEVFAAIENQPEEPVEELLPPPEEPVARPEPAPAPVIPEPEPEPEPEIVAEEAEPAPAPAPAPAQSPPAQTAPPAAPEPKASPAPPAAQQQPQPAAASASASGSYVIQLAALQSRAAATSAWETLVKTHTRLLAPLTLDIEPVNVPDKGTFYRLRGAAFATKAEAEQRCSELKAAGQACLVKSR